MLSNESLRKIIAIDSGPEQGTEDCIAYLKQICESNALSCEQHSFENIYGDSVLIAYSPKHKHLPQLILQANVDTENPGLYSYWTNSDCNPFNASIINESIYGLGCASGKLDALAKLSAVIDTKDSELKICPVFMASFHRGAFSPTEYLLNHKLIQPKFALVSEASANELVIGSCTQALVKLSIPFSAQEVLNRQAAHSAESTSTQSRIFRGRSTHASTPHLGSSAYEALLKYIKNLPENILLVAATAGESYFSIPSDALLELDLSYYPDDRVLSNLIQANHILEQIAKEHGYNSGANEEDESILPSFSVCKLDSMESSIDIYISVFLSLESDASLLEKHFSAFKTTGIQFNIQEFWPGRCLKANDSFLSSCLQNLESLNIASKIAHKNKFTDATSYLNRNIPAIAFGPGSSLNNVNTANEHIHLADLNSCYRFYKQMIERNCQ